MPLYNKDKKKKISKKIKKKEKKETFDVKKVAEEKIKKKVAISEEKFRDSTFFMEKSASIDKSKILLPKNLEQSLEDVPVKIAKPEKELDYLSLQDEEEKTKYASMDVQGPNERFNPLDKTSTEREKEFRDQSIYTNLRNSDEQLKTMKKTSRDPNYVPRPIKKPDEKPDSLKKVNALSEDYIH